MTQPENRVNYPALDGLRAVAFLMVFSVHYVSFPWGWTGVNMFFVLSGFLITGILFDTADSPHRVHNFYVRRTLRIFPLYYGLIIVVILLYPLAHWHWSITWLAWPLYLGNFLRFLSPHATALNSPLELAADARLFTARNWSTLTSGRPIGLFYFGHFWSLCVEEQFYLIWPWIVFSVRRRKTLLWICGTTAVLLPIVRLVLQQTMPQWMLTAEFLYRFTPLQADSLLLGGWAALMWRGPHRQELLKWSRLVATIMATVAIVYCIANARNLDIAHVHTFRLYPYPRWAYSCGITYVNFLSASLVVCLLAPSKWLSVILGNRAMRWIGKISYGAYVLHDVFHNIYGIVASRIQRELHLTDGDGIAIYYLLGLGCTLTMAWLSFRFYESHFLNLKERWTKKDAVRQAE